jgi:acyl-CoA thioesterase-1
LIFAALIFAALIVCAPALAALLGAAPVHGGARSGPALRLLALGSLLWIGSALANSAAQSGAPAPATILVLGDSLSAEYGLPRNSGWVALLAARLGKEAPQYSVVNASISGDTSSGGLARLEPLLQRHHPAIVIIELGANDGLRGLRIDAMQANIQTLIDRCRAQKARVLLIGMRLPPNYGPDYEEGFHAAFVELARRNHLAFTPFLLDGFADRTEWFQADHIHPLAQAEARMLDNVWLALAPLLRKE